jgi:hypothetical protein
MSKELIIRIKLERLITIREAMKADNTFRESINSGLAYGEESFMELAEEIKELVKEVESEAQDAKL